MLNAITPVGQGAGYIIYLLPNGYDLSAFSINDVIAGIMQNVDAGYSGEQETIYDRLQQINIVGGNIVFGDPWTAIAGTYTVLYSFFSDYDDPVTQNYAGTIRIRTVPSVVSFGNITLTPVVIPEPDPGPDCPVLAEIKLSSPIAPILDSENGMYFVILVDLLSNPVAILPIDVDTGYIGELVSITDGKFLNPVLPVDPENIWEPIADNYFLGMAFYRDGGWVPTHLYIGPYTVTLPCPIDLGSIMLTPVP